MRGFYIVGGQVFRRRGKFWANDVEIVSEILKFAQSLVHLESLFQSGIARVEVELVEKLQGTIKGQYVEA